MKSYWNEISQWNSIYLNAARMQVSFLAKESNRVSLFFAASAIQSAAGPMLQQEFRQISGRSAKKVSRSAPRERRAREIIKKDPGGAACTAQRDVIYLSQKRQIHQKWFCRGEWMRHTIIYYCGTSPLEFDGLWDGCRRPNTDTAIFVSSTHGQIAN